MGIGGSNKVREVEKVEQYLVYSGCSLYVSDL